MSVFLVTTPGPYVIKMAYNPIIINVLTQGVNPVIFVDVYFNGTYYKTVTSNSPGLASAFGTTNWNVDISDVCQEYLRSSPPSTLLDSAVAASSGSSALCSVKVRGSSLANGILYPDTPVPVQATVDTPAQAGGGSGPLQGGVWQVLNGALQLEQEQDPATYLAANVPGFNSAYKIYNLYTNPRLGATPSTRMQLPVYFPPDSAGPIGQPNTGVPPLYLGIITNDNRIYYSPQPFQYQPQGIYYLPAGPKNLLPILTAGSATPLDFSRLRSYSLFLNSQGGIPTGIAWQSRPITIRSNCHTAKRFRFVNWLGHYESISFEEATEDYGVQAARWQQYNAGSFSGAFARDSAPMSQRRYNVRANEEMTVTGYFQEGDMPYVKQFLSSPTVFQEVADPVQDYLRGVVLLDVTVQTAKIEDRWVYEVTAKLVPSFETITLRS